MSLADVVPITAARKSPPKVQQRPKSAQEAYIASYMPPEAGTDWQAPMERLICRRFLTMSPKEKAAQTIKATLLDFEGKAGSTFIRSTDERAWIWSEDKQKILPIDFRHKPFTHWASNKYGLLPTDGTARMVVSDLAAHVMKCGDLRTIRRFSYYDKDAHVLYLSRYDGTSYRIDGDKIEVVPNGDGALFLDDEGGVPTEALIPILHGGPPDLIWKELIDDLHFATSETSGMSADAQKRLLMVWLCATAFPDLIAAKPILLVMGSAGSGKSSTIQRFQRLILGRDRSQIVTQQGEENFGTTILRESIALLDNVDNQVQWLQDALAAYTTSGSWTKRKLYTDDEVVYLQPHAFITIATKNPATFRRDDLADRSILIELARRAGSVGGIGLDALLGRVTELRPRLYGEYLWYLNRIVRELKQVRESDDAPIQHRMADFARFAHIAGRVLGFDRGQVEAALGQQVTGRLQLTSDGDVLLEVLDRWLDINNGRQISPGTLYAELNHLALSLHLTFYKNLRTLVDRLRRPDEALRALCDVTAIETRDAHTGGRHTLYEIRRKA